MVKGTIKWVPKEFLIELNNIKFKFNLKDSDCFRRIAEDARIGREIKFTLDRRFKNDKR